MIKIKTGAEVNGLRTEMLLAITVADTLYTKHNVDCVITEGTGGKHGIGSLHYVGLAVDLRTRDMDVDTQVKVRQELQEALGRQYDVLREKDHMHIEFQPK